MADLNATVLFARAYLATFWARCRDARARLARSRHVLVSAALVVAGLLGALGGGALIGRWCLGLVLLAESAGAVWVGLNRDDGTALPRRGERTPIEAAQDHARGLP